MNESSGLSALLGVIVGVLIIGGIIFFWANGTFTNKGSTTVNVPAPTINVPAPAAPTPGNR